MKAREAGDSEVESNLGVLSVARSAGSNVF